MTDEGPTLSRQPMAWRLLLIPAAIQLLLHLFTNGNYGIFRDEYYYLACAGHPALGYVDQPPLSIWILTVWKAVFGDGVHALRVLPGLCGAGVVVLAGAMAAEMGGRRWAQFLAAAGAGIGSAGLILCGFYSMNSFDIVVWAGAYLLITRIACTGDGRLWQLFGLVVGIGLFNKIGLLVLGPALIVGLLATPHRRHFRDRRLWLAGGIAVAFLVPYVIWNFANDWPTLEFIRNAQLYKISDLSPLEFLQEVVLEANPLTVPLWVGGLLWLAIAAGARRLRLLAIMFVVTFLILILQKSKPYYFAGSLTVMMAAGGVAWERWTDRSRWHWARWAFTLNLAIGLAVFVPMAVPLLSPDGTVVHLQRLGVVPQTGEDVSGALPQYFSDRFGWRELAQKVAMVYNSLPAEDQKRCIIITRNYGQAGALEYWARDFPLPPVTSIHNNYWLWGYPAGAGDVVITVDIHANELEGEFATVEEAGFSSTPFARESHIEIRVCRDPIRPLAEFWADSRMFI